MIKNLKKCQNKGSDWQIEMWLLYTYDFVSYL